MTHCRHGYPRLHCGECSTLGERMRIRETANHEWDRSHGGRREAPSGTIDMAYADSNARQYFKEEMQILEREKGPRGNHPGVEWCADDSEMMRKRRRR